MVGAGYQKQAGVQIRGQQPKQFDFNGLNMLGNANTTNWNYNGTGISTMSATNPSTSYTASSFT